MLSHIIPHPQNETKPFSDPPGASPCLPPLACPHPRGAARVRMKSCSHLVGGAARVRMKSCSHLVGGARLAADKEQSEVSQIMEGNVGFERLDLTKYVWVRWISESASPSIGYIEG